MRKRLVCTFLFLLCMVVIVACTNNGNDTTSTTTDNGGTERSPEDNINPPGEYPIVKEPITLRVFMVQGSSVENIATNNFTKHIEELTNLQFDWDIAPSEGFNERKQLALASGDLPDVFLNGGFTKEEQIRYGQQQGILIPLNDLIYEYAPNVVAAFDEVDYLLDSVTAPDGNIYAMPQVNECYHCWLSQKLWINTEWLEKLNLDIPETTEELYEVLKAFKELDPNETGVADTIPLSGAINSWRTRVDGFLMSPFIYNDQENYFIMENGKVDLAANKPEWREGLQFIKRLVDDGLVDPQSFIQTNDELRQLGNNPDVNILGSFTAGHVGMVVRNADDNPRHTHYDTVPPLLGPNGHRTTGWYQGIGDSRFAITSEASEEQAIAAIRLLDYMYSMEGTLGDEFGLEGSFWHPPGPNDLDFHGRPAAFVIDPEWFTATIQNEHWAQGGPSYRPRDRFESRGVSQDLYTMDGYELRLFVESDKYYPYIPDEVYPLSVFMSPEEAEEAAHLRTSINDYIEENMVQFVLGHMDLESNWESYVNGFEGLGLERYLEIYQKAYDESNFSN